MSLLLPLGLLGLLGIVLLILIYILKPNYQQKLISSTYVWKLSLKYRRKRIPVNRLRNLLIIICQILIVTACALILARPVIAAEVIQHSSEKIAIIDASANMMTSYEGKTRFERAVEEVKALADTVAQDGGYLTVIWAGDVADDPVKRADSEALDQTKDSLDNLYCTYGNADMDGAIKCAQAVLDQNPDAELLFYTGTKYINQGNMTVIDVSSPGEWNAAVLSCTATVEENYYTFTIEVASYGRDNDITLTCEIRGVNDVGNNVTLQVPVRCSGDLVQTVTFSSDNLEVPIFSFKEVYVHVDEQDNFSFDNTFFLYGGRHHSLKMQYCSTLQNNFVDGALLGLRDVMKDRWDIDLDLNTNNGTPILAGYDFYIFEHTMPSVMPTDGVSFLINPDKVPEGLGIMLGERTSGEYNLAAGVSHTITTRIDTEMITVTEYTPITECEGFDTLMFCAGSPVFIVRNQPDEKVAVLSFSLNMSNLAVLLEFPLMMYNMVEYFLPSTITQYVYDVNDSVTLNARGTDLKVTGTGTNVVLQSFPGELSLTRVGTYTLTQTLLSGEEVTENFYVKIPAVQSNILRTEDELLNPTVIQVPAPVDVDLLIWFASALVALLFIEWILQALENF